MTDKGDPKWYTVLTVALLIIAASLLQGCGGPYETRGYLYVASTPYGYRVASNSSNEDTTYVSNNMTVEEAKALADKLNADIPAKARPFHND